MSPGPSPASFTSGPASSPSASTKRDRSNTTEEIAARAHADRAQKRTRVRQACNRCKARKIKCGDLRPCKNCTSLGLVCRDWRPGEDPSDHATYINPAGRSSSAAIDPLNEQDAWAAPEYPLRMHDHPTRHPSADHANISADIDARAQRSGSAIPWPNTPYERSRHTVAWPPKPDPKRHRYLAYPYDSIYRNEFGHLKALSLSSGLGTLSYLHEYHKLANEQFLDALWQVLEGENQDGVNMQMFALENESFSPHSHASHPSSGLGAPTAPSPTPSPPTGLLEALPPSTSPSPSMLPQDRLPNASRPCRFRQRARSPSPAHPPQKLRRQIHSHSLKTRAAIALRATPSSPQSQRTPMAHRPNRVGQPPPTWKPAHHPRICGLSWDPRSPSSIDVRSCIPSSQPPTSSGPRSSFPSSSPRSKTSANARIPPLSASSSPAAPLPLVKRPAAQRVAMQPNGAATSASSSSTSTFAGSPHATQTGQASTTSRPSSTSPTTASVPLGLSE